MSYIPNARSKYVEGLYKNTRGAETEPRENAYWHKNLDKDGRNVLIGFDACVSAVNNLFDNLETYEEKIGHIFGEDFLRKIDFAVVNGSSPYPEITGMIMDDNFPETGDVSEDYRDIENFSEEEIDKMSDATKILLLFKYILNDWMEMERDEVNTGLIESMEED